MKRKSSKTEGNCLDLIALNQSYGITLKRPHLNPKQRTTGICDREMNLGIPSHFTVHTTTEVKSESKNCTSRVTKVSNSPIHTSMKAFHIPRLYPQTQPYPVSFIHVVKAMDKFQASKEYNSKHTITISSQCSKKRRIPYQMKSSETALHWRQSNEILLKVTRQLYGSPNQNIAN